MEKIRVYELSKELGVSSKKVLDVAKELDIEARSHVSTLSKDQVSKIKEKVLGMLGASSKSSKVSEPKSESKEEVKVFTSETGQEVVERRIGDRVIIRRKRKKKEEPKEVESSSEDILISKTETQKEEVKEKESFSEEVELPAGERVTTSSSQIEEEVSGGEESRVEAVEKGKEIVTEEITLPLKEDEEKLESVKVSKSDIGKKKLRGEDKEWEEEIEKKEPKKAKKKRAASKPKKEEIIDTEVLEELRKVFRTKLPGRKREYVFKERKIKSRHDLKKEKAAQVAKSSGEKQQITTTTSVEAERKVAPSAKKVIKISEDAITVGELAKKMQVKASELIKKLMLMGIKATINQVLDEETVILVADEFGYEVKVEKFEEEALISEGQDTSEEELLPRPPVVTVMGHVDHGKTTLLDTIRKTNVVSNEAGGITQHIGAYKVSVDGRTIVFIDTPGHEAFTSMRARGAEVTDIVILVVAADDGVMPQTVEAINHAKAAGVPIIVAINKIDKPEANPEAIKRQLSEYGLIPEEWGGDTLFAEISAKANKGIDQLLDLVLLQADVMELKAPVNKRASGVVIEAKLDKGKGPLCTVLVKEGTLKVGDHVVAGTHYGRVRALIDDQGNRIKEAGPSIPVEIMGLSGVPEAGENFYVVKNERIAREIVEHREEVSKKKRSRGSEQKVSLEELYESLGSKETKELNLIIKADAQGTVEALKKSLNELSTEKCKINIIHTGVGAISETDISLASASDAIVVGFNVRPDAKAKKLAEQEGVSVELHNVIYDVVSRIRNAMEGLLEPILKEKVIGHVEVRKTFKISKAGTVAGGFVTDGKVVRDANVKVVRDGVVVYDGKISSLKRFKDDVKEVQSGYECGISVSNFNDIKVGDVLEVYVIEEIKQQL